MLRSLIKLGRFGAALIGLILAAPEIVAGQALGPTPQPVRFSLRASDAVVFGAGAVASAIPSLAGTSLPYGQCNPCDSTSLWGIDRATLGLPRGSVSDLSTATMGATTLGAAALVALTRRGEPEANRAAFEDLAVMIQAVELDAAVTQWAKVLFHRARPVLYTSESGQNQTVDAGRSFPSGHASFSFAAAAAAASILARRHELGSHKLETALLFAGAALTGSLRVAAHKHFPTDVAAGAVLGTVVGWVYPQLHPVR